MKHVWEKMEGERESVRAGVTYFFVQCRTCDVRIIASQSAVDSGLAWVGWKGLYETCEETQAWDVMEG